MSKVVFLDRDGVLNYDRKNFIKTPQEFILYPYTVTSLAKLKKAGFKLFIITNQSGVGRGIITMENLNLIHNKLFLTFTSFGVYIDDIYVCPHHPKAGCICRKPSTFMYQKALSEHNLLPSVCYCIGDRPSDIEAGNRMGYPTFLVLTGKGRRWVNFICNKTKPNYIVPTLAEAVEEILNLNGRE